MLFDPDRHEALCENTWNEPWAREAVQSIVRNIEQHRTAEGPWPAHPLDIDGDAPHNGFKSMYLGSAGVLWALWCLQRQGAVTLSMDRQQGIERAHAAYQSDPDTGQVVPSYLLGEVGILLARWCMSRSNLVADKLYAAVQSNIPNPTNEALWAAPGTIVAAWHMWEATQQPRWRELFLDNVEQLWRTWLFDASAQCHLWTQDMYGKVVQYLGAGHGFAGNVYPLLKGASLLDADRRAALYERCVTTLQTMAKIEGDAINWPPGTFKTRPGAPSMLMQWCHGAPGFVTALADFPPHQSPAMNAMLVGAGHAVWHAGPLTKGYGLCHGTAGNGYAFLKLYQRTGDSMWLDRARAFAVHAMAQRARMRQAHGQERTTLWTGDAGLAMYLWHCIDGTADMPGLDALC
jgi:hypothetical protein